MWRVGMDDCDAHCPDLSKWTNSEANVEDLVPSETDENAGEQVRHSLLQSFSPRSVLLDKEV